VTPVHTNRDREAWPQFAEFSAIVFEFDAHLHPLDDLGEIAGRILRRDDAELRARGRREACNATTKTDTRQHVGNDFNRLARSDARQLTFLEIGVNPQAARRNDGEQLGSGCRIGASARAAVTDYPVDWRANFCIGKIEEREIALGQSLIESRLGLLLLRGDDIKLALCSIERRSRPALRRPRLLMVRISLFETLAGSELIGAQCSIPVEVIFGAGQFGGRACNRGRRLFDYRLVHAPVGVDIGES